MTQTGTSAADTPVVEERSFTVDTRQLYAALIGAYPFTQDPYDKTVSAPIETLQMVYLIPHGDHILVGATDRYSMSAEDLPFTSGTPFPVALNRTLTGTLINVAHLALETSTVFEEIDGQIRMRVRTYGYPSHSWPPVADNSIRDFIKRIVEFREAFDDPDTLPKHADGKARYHTRRLQRIITAVQNRSEALKRPELTMQFAEPVTGGCPLRILSGTRFRALLMPIAGPTGADQAEGEPSPSD